MTWEFRKPALLLFNVVSRLDLFVFISQAVFEGVRGGGSRSDIAIDDVSMTSGECSAAGEY